eukprot:CAMPEP_0174748576 /NCGR_PEP_ID=MMETSP1094-20130205/93822_1 /TAXON_ID=156173 /ORGANISM="Chrysochromulina brevifilum, Strain UTEX LB 985" /LENGTH=96 /DNA_ID=CAMNT_0015953641 /DNA_START=250 /DNA_END=536 /DNA_ORIENTATION=+
MASWRLIRIIIGRAAISRKLSRGAANVSPYPAPCTLLVSTRPFLGTADFGRLTALTITPPGDTADAEFGRALLPSIRGAAAVTELTSGLADSPKLT